MAALLRTDEDDVDITEDELCRAVAKSKTSAPGDDGITYQVLRLLLKYPGNHLLKLYNLCFSPRICASCMDYKYHCAYSQAGHR